MPQDMIPTTLPTPSGDAGAGSSDLASDLMKDLLPAAAPASPAAPAAQPAAETPKPGAEPAKPAGEPAKPAGTQPPSKPPVATPAKPAPAAPPSKPVDLNPDDPKLSAVDLRKELKRIKESSTLTVREREKQINELQGKITEFEKRRYYTDEDLKLHEASTKRLASLEAELYARDYTISPEYKSKFQDRIDAVWKQAVEEGQGLTVKYKDGDDDKTRPATQKDLMMVIDAPPGQRMAIAKNLFGEDRDQVLTWAREIALIRQEAAKAIEDKRNGYQSEVQTRAKQFADANQRIAQFTQEVTQKLVEAQPEIFAAPEDKPEIKAALDKGFGFVDQSTRDMNNMNINERAARAAVIRAMAGAFPRLTLDLREARARIAELEAKLGGYQKTDPSEMGGEGGGGAPASDGGGSDAMAQELAALDKR